MGRRTKHSRAVKHIRIIIQDRVEVFTLKRELLCHRQAELTRARQFRKETVEVLQCLQPVKERIVTTQVPAWPPSPTWTWESDFPNSIDDTMVLFNDGTDRFMVNSVQVLPQNRQC
jgi:hypothetical protein